MTVEPQPDWYDVFLSHAHVDAAVVESLASRLVDEGRFSVWLDRWILVPGKHWQQEMAKGLDLARTCAVCVGGKTPAGWFREEIQRALNRQTKDETFRVIPVILPGGDACLIDEFLELRTWVDFKDGIQDGYAFHLLTCGVKGVAPGRYEAKLGIVSPQMAGVREMLASIRTLRDEQLIDRDIAAEYQRRILDKLVGP
jgi:TIR domain